MMQKIIKIIEVEHKNLVFGDPCFFLSPKYRKMYTVEETKNIIENIFPKQIYFLLKDKSGSYTAEFLDDKYKFYGQYSTCYGYTGVFIFDKPLLNLSTEFCIFNDFTGTITLKETKYSTQYSAYNWILSGKLNTKNVQLTSIQTGF